ncbi:MAG TPA: aldehyde dehydrogenase family protein [Flavisolibacter sp.]|nr:aldehyde dehydrogenase family protein [Flavisolibacter sp.]
MQDILKQLGIHANAFGASTGTVWLQTKGKKISSFSPVDGKEIGSVISCDAASYDLLISSAQQGFLEWRTWPSPKRGEVVRQLGEALRQHKEPLGKLVSYEMGKSLQEGYGEVQEMIDICDFAVGLSRQLHGLTMHSDRPGHRMYEQWHPLGVVGIISAFNFPVAVWSWNAMLAWVCGNACVWKPSEKTPLSAIACQQIVTKIFSQNNVPEGVSCLLIGEKDMGERMAHDFRIPLLSATGSTRMGKAVSAAVGARLGRSLLELGGNNAIIITPDADLNIAIPGCVFGAVGTAGQRCTTTRRLIIHESIYDTVKEKLAAAYRQLRIGNPLDEKNHMGPLIDQDAVQMYQEAIEKIKSEGGRFVVEGGILEGEGFDSGCYIKPCIAEDEPHF